MAKLAKPNPCPWCGGMATIKEFSFRIKYFACCAKFPYCGQGPSMITKEDAIAAWNKVAKPKKSKTKTARKGKE